MVTPETEALIRASVVVDIFNTASAKFWRRRAEEFERAKPRKGDFHGLVSREELSAAWQRCHSIAEACRQKAHAAEMGGESWEAVPTQLAS